MKLHRRQFLAGLPAVAVIGACGSARGADERVIQMLLQPIRDKHELPALAGAIVTTEGIVARAAVGVRKAGTSVAVTADDLWHLGSNTKAMTATLAAMAVEAGKLRWDSKVMEVFPKAAGLKGSALAAVTLTQLLSHRSGLPANLKWRGLKDRAAVLKMATGSKMLSAPGEKFLYSNLGFVVAGHMIEEVMSGVWEDLMRERLFKPLQMRDAGFGGTGTIGAIDQPWPHVASGNPAPKNGAGTDNPAVIGPAGTVHATLEAWGRFVADHLAGARGAGKLLKPALYAHLHTARPGETYAYGWGMTKRAWGGGEVLTHTGSNTMNHSVAWLAPLRGFAVLACTNRGGADAAKACDAAAAALISEHTKA